MIASAPSRSPVAVGIRREGGRPRFDDLWFLLGSRCNLACIHCYVGSSPTKDDLEGLALSDVRRFLDEGVCFGLRHAYFTGGEPFLNPEILPILGAALAGGREATVLTNGTRPFRKRIDAFLALLASGAGRLHVRVSLDHYDEARHDAIRGSGMFRQAVEAVQRIAEAGGRPIVTVTAEVFRGNPITPGQAEARFRDLFGARSAEVDVKILPAVLPMGSQRERIDKLPEPPSLTKEYLAGIRLDPATLMCASGRSILKKAGRLRVYPCPIIYEVPDYDLGATLEESFARAVPLAHVACATYCCRPAGRGTCANG